MLNQRENDKELLLLYFQKHYLQLLTLKIFTNTSRALSAKALINLSYVFCAKQQQQGKHLHVIRAEIFRPLSEHTTHSNLLTFQKEVLFLCKRKMLCKSPFAKNYKLIKIAVIFVP